MVTTNSVPADSLTCRNTIVTVASTDFLEILKQPETSVTILHLFAVVVLNPLPFLNSHSHPLTIHGHFEAFGAILKPSA